MGKKSALEKRTVRIGFREPYAQEVAKTPPKSKKRKGQQNKRRTPCYMVEQPYQQGRATWRIDVMNYTILPLYDAPPRAELS